MIASCHQFTLVVECKTKGEILKLQRQSSVFLLFCINIYIIHLHYIQLQIVAYKILYFYYFTSLANAKLCVSIILHSNTKKVNQLHGVTKKKFERTR